MSGIRNFFENVWFFTGHLTKRAYTNGLIAFSGAVAVAVLFIGVYGFTSTANISNVPAYEAEEEEVIEPADKELVIEEATSEEFSMYVEWAKAQQKTAEDETQANAVSLVQETDVQRHFRTSGNVGASTTTLLSAQDYTALLRIVEAEATGEDLHGKILIANVVMNRVDSGRFPDSIYEVVHQEISGRAQFSPIDDGRYYRVSITDSTVQAVEAALKGTDYSEGALFFVAKSLTSDNAASWFDNNLEFLFKHGVHYFYKY